MKIKDLLEQNREHIVQSYLSGKSTCALGREFGINSANIYMFLRDKCGVNLPKKNNKHIHLQDKMVELYHQNISLHEIAKQLKCSRQTVGRYLDKLGLDTGRFSCQHETPLDHEAIVQLHKEGWGCTRLAKHFNCGETEINRIRKKYGIAHHPFRHIEFNDNYFEIIDTEDKAYFLGVFYADGWVDKRYTNAKISVTDKEIIENLIKYIGYVGDIKERAGRKTHHKRQYSVPLCSSKLCHDLSKQGCMPKKSFIIKYPTLEQVPSNLVKHWLRGVIDGDGSIGIQYKVKWGKPRYWTTIVGTMDLLNGIKDYIYKELGIDTTVAQYKPMRKTTARLHFKNKGDIAKFLKWLYQDATIYLQRKYDRAQEILQLEIEQLEAA